MNIAIIMLGSNIDADFNLKLADEKISLLFNILKVSSKISSKAFGTHYLSDFCNKAIKLESSRSKDESISIFKKIEMEMGRTSESKQKGIIPIDIDLIFWNGNQIHTDYDRFDFVMKCVDEIS